MSQAATITWFARHEFRLAWRDWLSMMTAGRRGRERLVAIGLTIFAVLMHLFAWSIVGNAAKVGLHPTRPELAGVTGALFLSFSLMLSQAMESVTRAFYSRSDLELILSSPVATRRIFVVRIAILAASTALLGLVVAAPFINVLAALGGARWLTAYGVVASMGLVAAALAVALTIALFRTIGPKRTRLVAQVAAAIIGAAFVIGLQITAILSYGTISRDALIKSSAFLGYAPQIDSYFWWPARAALGDWSAFAATLSVGFVVLALAVTVFSTRFGEHVIAASGVAATGGRQGRAKRFRNGSPLSALRRKEWALLRRDPWLMSQTLMQLLYLVPPALLLWLSFSHDSGALVLLVLILVMAAGQLAGGLAWLAISGEDAPDLVATAPFAPRSVIRAKVEAVMVVIALVFTPFLLAMALSEPYFAFASLAGIAASAPSAIAIQLWFRTQAKRSHFGRRQTSSRMATFAEAFSSIIWAATAVLAAAGLWQWIVTGVIAIIVLAGARMMAPRPQA